MPVDYLHLLFTALSPVAAAWILTVAISQRTPLSTRDATLIGFLAASGSIVLAQTVAGYLNFFGSIASAVVPLFVLLVFPLRRRLVFSKTEKLDTGSISQPIDVSVIRIFVVAGSLVLLTTALFANPLNHDSLAYRLPRLSYWLQEGSIRHFDSTDVRHNYLGVNAELITAWILAPFSSGYLLTSLLQGASAIMLLLSIFGFCRAIGFSS